MAEGEGDADGRPVKICRRFSREAIPGGKCLHTVEIVSIDSKSTGKDQRTLLWTVRGRRETERSCTPNESEMRHRSRFVAKALTSDFFTQTGAGRTRQASRGASAFRWAKTSCFFTDEATGRAAGRGDGREEEKKRKGGRRLDRELGEENG